MALGTTGISVSLIQTTLGESSTDVGTLCKSSSINKWSKYKPFVSTALFHTMSELLTDLQSKHFGLSEPTCDDKWAERLDDTDAYAYTKPSGGASSPYRLGDFRKYNHDADAPVNTLACTDVYMPFNSHTVTLQVGISGSDTGIGLSELWAIQNMYLGILFTKDNWATVYLATSQATLATGVNSVSFVSNEPIVTNTLTEWKIRAIAVNMTVTSGRLVLVTDTTLASARYCPLPFANISSNNATFNVHPQMYVSVDPTGMSPTPSSTPTSEWTVFYTMVLENGPHATNDVIVEIQGISVLQSGDTWQPYYMSTYNQITIPKGSKRPSLSTLSLISSRFGSPPYLGEGSTVKLIGEIYSPSGVNISLKSATFGNLA